MSHILKKSNTSHTDHQWFRTTMQNTIEGQALNMETLAQYFSHTPTMPFSKYMQNITYHHKDSVTQLEVNSVLLYLNTQYMMFLREHFEPSMVEQYFMDVITHKKSYPTQYSFALTPNNDYYDENMHQHLMAFSEIMHHMPLDEQTIVDYLNIVYKENLAVERHDSGNEQDVRRAALGILDVYINKTLHQDREKLQLLLTKLEIPEHIIYVEKKLLDVSFPDPVKPSTIHKL